MAEVLLFLAEGFEEIEVNTPICYLRHSGISLQTVSVTGNKLVTGAHGVPVVADILFEEVSLMDVRMLILPGGVPGALNLSRHQGLNEMVSGFMQQGKAVAAICAGPLVLGSLGLLQGKNIVCYPGFESYMHGANVIKDQSAVVDGNLITANGPAAAMLFSFHILKMLRNEAEARSMADGMMVNYF